jgi:hypothetical protein
MASEQLPELDVTTIPQLADLAEEVRRTRTPKRLVLTPNGVTVGYLDPPETDFNLPAKTSPRKTSRRGKRFTMADPIWDIEGMASVGPSDVSSNKDKYLAEAYATKGA